MRERIVIVGGGISGLVAAYRARRLAPEAQVILIESAPYPGGKIVTERLDGFIVEGGPDCFLSRKGGGIELCEELGLTSHLMGRLPQESNSYVKRDGVLHPLPEGLTGMVPTNLDALARSTLISAAGRARLAEETTIPPADGEEDESLASFARRRFGAEVFEWLVEPLMGGIYAGDAEQLSLHATFPHLRALERQHGSLLRALAQNGKKESSGRLAPYPPFVSLHGGMACLVDALVERLGEGALRTGTIVTGVHREGKQYGVMLAGGDALLADALILATPAYVTADLLAWDSTLAGAHRAIPYASTALVSLGFEAAELPPLEGYGYVIPRAEQENVKACTWSSSKWAGRAPTGMALLRLYLGRFGGPEMTAASEHALIRMAREELRNTLGIRATPRLVRIHRWPRALPQYTLGHPERVAAIKERLKATPGLFVAGAAYRGIGIPDCILSGEAAARDAIEHLRGRDGHNDGHNRD